MFPPLYIHMSDKKMLTDLPELLAEWDYDKNSDNPEILSAGLNRKVWWVCSRGHSYEALISTRTGCSNRKPTGCPYCAGKKAFPGFNDLQTTHPDLASQWDYAKNRDITPQQVTDGSIKKYWWICSNCGESYLRDVNSQSKSDKCFCFKCGRKVGTKTKLRNMTASGTSLETVFPEIAAEWHPTKNAPVIPTDVTPHSGKSFWWLCPICGAEWKETVNTRTKGEGCPNCAHAHQTSEPEQVIYYYISKAYPNAINSFRPDWLHRKEIDIYIPDLMLAIEYDGCFWHKDEARDNSKAIEIMNHGIHMVRIRKKGLPSTAACNHIIEVDEYYRNPAGLNEAIVQLFRYIECVYGIVISIEVNVEEDNKEVVDMFVEKRKNRSFAAARPDLIVEWDTEKNGNLTPYNTVASSHKRVWWKCVKCGYEWETDPASRYSKHRGTGCPRCGQEKVNEAMQSRNLIAGETDLATVYPEIAAQWNYERNESLPSEYTVSSNKSVWWKCKEGHEWQAKIASRTRFIGKGTGCPYCSGHRVLQGYNDLKSVNPVLADEFAAELNEGLSPSMVTSRSNIKVWWRCSTCGHIWKTTVCHRASGQGCPACANKKKGKRK